MVFEASVSGSTGVEGQHTWQCVDQPERAWPSKAAGEDGALYVVVTVHSDHVHMVGAAELRA